MPLQSSGAISLLNIQGEFGGSSSNIAISNYYRGGSNVPNTTVNNSIPTSGQIQFDDFYGGASATADNNFSFTVQSYSTGSGKNVVTYRGANGSMSDGAVTTNNLNSYTITNCEISTLGLSGIEIVMSGSGNGYNMYTTGNVRGMTVGGTTYSFLAPSSGANSLVLENTTAGGGTAFDLSTAQNNYMTSQVGNSVTFTLTY